MACPICGDWRHVGTQCPKMPKGWKPVGISFYKPREEVVSCRPEVNKTRPPAIDHKPGAGLARPKPHRGPGKNTRLIAPKGECAYCDRRREAVSTAVKKHRGDKIPVAPSVPLK